MGLPVWYRWERPELIYVPTERIQTQKDAILIKFGVSQSFFTSRTHGMYLNGTRVKGRDQSWSEVTPRAFQLSQAQLCTRRLEEISLSTGSLLSAQGQAKGAPFFRYLLHICRVAATGRKYAGVS